MKQYDFCVLNSDVHLFRKFNHTLHEDVMFFAFSPYETFSETSNGNLIQKWKTNRKLKLIFLAKTIDNIGRVESNINEIFKIFNPSINVENFNELTIKQNRKDLLNIFKSQLISLGYDGWFTSIENNCSMEVCLFNKNNDSINYVKSKKYLRNISTLNNVNIFLYNSELLSNHSRLIYSFNKIDIDKKFIYEGTYPFTIIDLINNERVILL